MVGFGEVRVSRYTKYHPRAGQPSTLKGQDLGKGKSISLRHEVVALAAGEWTFQPVFHGAGGDAVEGEKKTVRVLAAQDGAAELLVNFDTSSGTIKARFWPDVAPATALHIVELVQGGYYDGLKFHRTIKGFMIQGGCPLGTGSGNPGYSIEAEFNERSHVAGVLSMARAGDPYESQGQMPRPEFANSAGSQFFLCDDAAQFLDCKYTAFGEVVEGLDVVHAIAAAPAEAQPNGEISKPVKPVIMKKVTLVPAGK
ncbi:MAG: peptidylprolyl isomerase [Planctomycetes bacterium]|nr:peptidylprolyl isomerase [Planctomycetota bacterium]